MRKLRKIHRKLPRVRKIKGWENLFILFLSIVAIGLLYFIYQKYSPSETQALNQETTVPAKAPSGVNRNPVTETSRQSYLTPEEKEAMKTPKPDDTDEVKMAFHGKVVKAAKKTNVIEISNCQPKPPVANIPYGSTFTFKNSGNTDHIVGFNKEKSYTVKKNSSVSVTAEFSIGPGIFGYGCDNSPKEVGLILSEKE